MNRRVFFSVTLVVVVGVISPRARAAPVDHGIYATVLRDTVHDGVVDYTKIRAKHRAALDGYLRKMARIDDRGLPKSERFALYLNVYNATVLRAVAERSASPGYRVSADGYALFKEPLVRLKGRTVSLDTLEKTITWNAFHDPRMHVGFVCAARSCPPLPARPFSGKDLDVTLDALMRAFVVDASRGNRYDEKTRTLYHSQIFEWYAKDFGGPDEIVAFIDRYHPASIPPDVQRKSVPYDWALNGR